MVLGVGLSAIWWGDGGPVGRPSPVDVPSGAPGKQGRWYDRGCTSYGLLNICTYVGDLKNSESDNSNAEYSISKITQ